MIGHKVFHNVFGYGTITAKEGTLITVGFGGTAKKFVYPDAFERFLVSTDQSFMSRVKSDTQKSWISK